MKLLKQNVQVECTDLPEEGVVKEFVEEGVAKKFVEEGDVKELVGLKSVTILFRC